MEGAYLLAFGVPVFAAYLLLSVNHRASEFAFYFRDQRTEAPGHPPVYNVETPGRAESVLVLAAILRDAFASVEPFRIVEVRRSGRLVRRLQVFLCRNYRTVQL